jgi:predicted GTPase
MDRLRTLIMGAAGRDFHNFNVVYRDSLQYEVTGFTAAQIPDIAGRRYPPELAGSLYPEGIPIFDERELAALVVRQAVRQVVFSTATSRTNT